MPVPARPLRITVEEYFALDAAAPEGVRYEYWDGYVVPQHGYDETGAVAMAGASPAHNQIALNLAASLTPAMRNQGCRGGQADQRVRLRTGRYVYPDLVFACDAPSYTDDHPPALLNPTLIVEVASPSTEDQDYGDKRRAYAALESLQAYWVVAQDRAFVTTYERDGQDWRLHEVAGLDGTVSSRALGLSVSLAEVYALVELPEGRP
jgi:Uma2 family endonuclease